MNKGYLYLVGAAMSYASMGVLIRFLSTDLGAWSQTFLRLIVSALITLIIVLIQRKRLSLKNPSDYLIMFFMGTIGYGIQILLFTQAIYETTIGNALFILSSYPIIAAVLAHYFLKEAITKRITVALVLLGCVLFLLFDPSGINSNILGNTYAFLAALTTAFYIICSRVLTKRGNSPETVTLFSVTLAVIVTGLGAMSIETISYSLTTYEITLLTIFGILNAAAFNFMNIGFTKVKAGVGTMVLLLEPIIGSFLGLVFFQEIPTMIFITGAIIMITAIYISTFKLD